MLKADQFLDALTANDISFASGVPCSFLSAPMQLLAQRGNYIPASIEGEAAAIAAGAWLAGKETAVFSQNSGLGNLVNTLTSLNEPFHVPTALVLGWRAAPGIDDEPQHQLMGGITVELLKQMQITPVELSTNLATMQQQVKEASDKMKEDRKSVGFLVRPESFEAASASHTDRSTSERRRGILHSLLGDQKTPTRFEALEAALGVVPDAAGVIATTGKCGRELFTIGDRDQNFYMVGSMGSASAIGLGVASAQQTKPVIVFDGDGAAMMRLGTMATIGHQFPKALTHVILDNGAHDSTGGQPTGSETVDFPNVALACGYAAAWQCGSLDCFTKALEQAIAFEGPTLVHLAIKPGSVRKLGRPTIAPHEVADRFKRFLQP